MHMFPMHLFSLARHFWVLTLANLQCTSVGPWESSTGSSFDRGSSATPRDEVELCHLFPTLPHCIDLPVCEGDFEWTILPLKNQVTVRAGMPTLFAIRLTCSPSKHCTSCWYCPYPPCQLTLYCNILFTSLLAWSLLIAGVVDKISTLLPILHDCHYLPFQSTPL